jgi:hypothetical protein
MVKYTPIPQKTKKNILYMHHLIAYQKNVIAVQRRQIKRLVSLGQSILDHPFEMPKKEKVCLNS